MAGKLAEADAFHAKHPYFSKKLSIQSKPRFQSLPEFYFALSDVLIAAINRRPPDPHWLPLFSELPDVFLDDKEKTEAESYRTLGLGLLTMDNKNTAPEARSNFIKATQLRTESLELVTQLNLDSSSLPNIFDRLVMLFGLSAASTDTGDPRNIRSPVARRRIIS